MMKWPAYHIALSLFMISTAFGQDTSSVSPLSTHSDSSTFFVDKVIVIGNSHTKEFVILREMSLKPGSPITEEMLEYDKNRIYSLGLFNRVELRAIPSAPPTAELIVEVNERWYIFPYPIFGIKDRDWSKLLYGVGLLHNNFRGRNEKLYGSLVIGYDPSIALAYRNPFLSEEGLYFLEGRIGYNKVRNKSLLAQLGSDNFDERHFSAFLTVGRRFGIEHTVWLTTGYEIVEVSHYIPGRSLSHDGRDKYPLGSVGYVYDTRDLQEYPGHGSFARATITKFGVSSGDVDITRYSLDLRKYIPLISHVVLTGRMFTDVVAGGTTPSYNRVFFGYSERVRGHFKEVMEGENIFGVSSEIHLTLLAPKYFVVDFLPGEFGVWKFSIAAALFADAGTVWFRGSPFALNAFARGYGGGFHFQLPYSTVIRTEYAWNEIRRGQFIFGLGASF